MARKLSTGVALLVLVVLSACVDVAVAARYDSALPSLRACAKPLCMQHGRRLTRCRSAWRSRWQRHAR